MFRRKGWDKIYKNTIREAFKWQLKHEILAFAGNRIIWCKPCIIDDAWFTCRYFALHAYPEDVFRCLDMVGIDRDLAHLAVDQMFQLQSLTPFYNVLACSSSENT